MFFSKHQLIRHGRAKLHTPAMNWVKWVQQQLHSYDMRVLSSVIVITQSGIKNIENVKFWGLLPCGMIPWQPLPMFRYYVCTIRGHLNNNEEVYSKVAASECYLGEGNLIFFCTGPIDSNFWQIKIIIIILISHMFFFLLIWSFSFGLQ